MSRTIGPLRPPGIPGKPQTDPAGRAKLGSKHVRRRSRLGQYMAGNSGGGARLAAGRLARPMIIVCAWCEANGLSHGAARDPASSDWWAVSHEYVRDAKHDGRTSHGICPV